MADPYFDEICRRAGKFRFMFRTFERQHPILEFQVAEGRIVAYPAHDNIDDLSERTRERTRQQYKDAVTDGDVIIFVRDNARKVLRSYILPLDVATEE